MIACDESLVRESKARHPRLWRTYFDNWSDHSFGAEWLLRDDLASVELEFARQISRGGERTLFQFGKSG